MRAKFAKSLFCRFVNNNIVSRVYALAVPFSIATDNEEEQNAFDDMHGRTSPKQSFFFGCMIYKHDTRGPNGCHGC